jgi:hypothetical protein
MSEKNFHIAHHSSLIAHRSVCLSSHPTGECLMRVVMGLIRHLSTMVWIGLDGTIQAHLDAQLDCFALDLPLIAWQVRNHVNPTIAFKA